MHILKINSVALYTLVRREIVRFVRIWIQTFLPTPITMLLYFLIFGQFMGDRIGPVAGFEYMSYIAPGLIMMAIINNAFMNVVSSFYSAKFIRNIEELFVAPVWSLTVLLGFVAGGILRALLVGSCVVGVALCFTTLPFAHPGLMVAIFILTATLFSLAGLLNGIVANKFDDVNIVPVFILSPLTYLGGVFYSVHLLSPFWQTVSHYNPIFYMVNAFRYAILGVEESGLMFSMAILSGLTVSLFLIVWYILEKGYCLRQ